jgi:hypothetical protein
MTDLSPAAESVIDAYHASVCQFMPHSDRGNGKPMMAAVIRAAIDQVAPLHVCNLTSTRGKTRLGLRTKLLNIAAELDRASHPQIPRTNHP